MQKPPIRRLVSSGVIQGSSDGYVYADNLQEQYLGKKKQQRDIINAQPTRIASGGKKKSDCDKSKAKILLGKEDSRDGKKQEGSPKSSTLLNDSIDQKRKRLREQALRHYQHRSGPWGDFPIGVGLFYHKRL
ncbi:MAG: hypothetical protein HQK50_13645 [Oligoflexia bacterium]|nr:hypothetical protein [Oligoflexia bacterium]